MHKVGGLTLRWFALAATAVLLSSFAVLGSAGPASAAGEGTILSLVNQARAANGLGPLALNPAISAVSAAWANQMAANGAMTHNPDYAAQMPGGWSRVAENVANGYSSPEAVHEGWMNSSGHRANILGDYTDIGIAFVSANGTTWAVENFGKYGASVPPPAPPAAPPAPPPAAPPAEPVAPAPPVVPPPVPEPSPSVSAEQAPSPSASPGESSDRSTNPARAGEGQRAGDERQNAAEGGAAGTIGGVLAAVVGLAVVLTILRLRRRWSDRAGA